MKVFLFLMFGLPCLSFARLGEDYASCVARYGEPIHTKENRVFRFHKNGYEIGVIMFDGNVGMIGFKKLGKDAKAVKMSDHEIERLLSVNSGPWKRFSKGSKEPRWIAPNEDQAGYELPHAYPGNCIKEIPDEKNRARKGRRGAQRFLGREPSNHQ